MRELEDVVATATAGRSKNETPWFIGSMLKPLAAMERYRAVNIIVLSSNACPFLYIDRESGILSSDSGLTFGVIGFEPPTRLPQRVSKVLTSTRCLGAIQHLQRDSKSICRVLPTYPDC